MRERDSEEGKNRIIIQYLCQNRWNGNLLDRHDSTIIFCVSLNISLNFSYCISKIFFRKVKTKCLKNEKNNDNGHNANITFF